MLIQALCDYYDTLSAQGKLVPEGYSAVKISYLISLTPEGNVDGILDCRQTETIRQKGGKEKEIRTPIRMTFPKRTEKPGIESNVVEHRPLYIFGLNYDPKTNTCSVEDKTNKAKKSHEAFVARSKAFFAGMESPLAAAFQNFLEVWDPVEEVQNPYILAVGNDFATAGFAFMLSGHPENLLQEAEEVRCSWEQLWKETGEEAETVQQCGILGQRLPVARIHDKIKGVPGGSSMGNTLVSFNNPAEYSYGQEQSYNSHISQLAMKKYTQALNFLMAEKLHRTSVDELVLFHWATDNNERCDKMLEMLLSGSDFLDAEDTEAELTSLICKIKTGDIHGDLDGLMQDIDKDVTFYIVGLKPNSARLSVKFIYRRQFGELFRNLVQHQLDLKISPQSRPISLNALTKELVSPKSSKQTVDTSLQVKILESILYGWRYPSFLLQTVVRRIQTDSDTEENRYIQMNDTRMGILKACINRDDRLSGREEEIKMALDKDNKTPAYLCGRLFAVLENIQQRASGYDLNRTIKDAYFTSASTRPAIVFPKLLTLAQHHMKKMENNYYADLGIEEILSDLGNEFPAILSLKEQGVFMLGYYQQKHEIREQIKAYKEDK